MEWLIERFQSSPELIAFIHKGREVSYGIVIESIIDYRKKAQQIGIKRGDTVVIVGDYSPEVFCMIIALSLNGAILIPLAPKSVVEFSAVSGISGCEWYVGFDDITHKFAVTYCGVKSENTLLKEFRQRLTPGIILFSSGSTGDPKGILHDFNALVEKFRKQRVSVKAIAFLMIDHFGGINTILSVTTSLGTLITVAERSVTNICSAIEKYKVELLPATPSFLTLMMVSKQYQNYDLSSLKRITYGTEVMPQLTLDRLRTHFPSVDLLQTYGLSEVGVLRSQSRNDGSLWVRLGGDGFNTKVVNGVLWVKSQFAMVGYLNSQSLFDDEGWFNTQDQVEVDGEYFRILGRVTDMINVGGQKVYPAEVENIILELDNIKDVAIFGEKHALLGQIVVAKVLLDAPEALDSLKKRIRQACIKKLSPYKLPSKIILSKELLYNSRQKKIRRE
jgi:acyl-coenzyme A synthetase/AMP-(fatty) acid ligase